MKEKLEVSIESSLKAALEKMSQKEGVSKSSLLEVFILRNLNLNEKSNSLVDTKYLRALNFFNIKPKKLEIEKISSEYPMMSYFLSIKSQLFKSVIPKGEEIEVILKKSKNTHLIKDTYFENGEDFLEKILEFMKIFDEEKEMEMEKEIKALEAEF